MRLPVVTFCVFLVVALGCGRQPDPVQAERANVQPSDVEHQIFTAVNAERTKRDLGALEWSDKLLVAARDHSSRMSKLGFFSHTDPDRGSLPERLRAHEIRYMAAGENLFALKGPMDPVKASVSGWLNSKEHRENMLSDRFRSTAVGVARASDGTMYMTQLFLNAGSR